MKLSRRDFLSGLAASGGCALGGRAWAAIAATSDYFMLSYYHCDHADESWRILGAYDFRTSRK